MTTPTTVLWVSAHPSSTSLNAQLARYGQQVLAEGGVEVITSDLYRLGWDPVLTGEGITADGQELDPTADVRRAYLEGRLPADVRREQEKLRAADALVVQFPLWWYSVPAILKGWFDRVLVSGFAFGTDEQSGRRLRFEHGTFVGTRALVVTTTGDRPASIGPRGKSGELTELLFGLLHGTLAYTGMGVLPPLAFPSADHTTPQVHAEQRRLLRRRLEGLFTDEVIAYRPQFQGDYTDEWELAPHVLPGQSGLSVHVTGS